LLEDSVFAHHLARQWMGLIEAGLAVEAVDQPSNSALTR
jgi:hypothetical protein